MQLKKKITLIFLSGLIIGALFFGGYLAYSAIQSQVGINLVTTQNPKLWLPMCSFLSLSNDGQASPGASQCDIPDSNTPLFIFNTSTNGWDRVRVSVADAFTDTGLLATGSMTFNGVTWDRQRSATSDALTATGLTASSQIIFNGATWDRIRSVNTSDGVSSGRGVIATGLLAQQANDATWRSLRIINAGDLTATTSVGTLLTTNLATWNVTSAPAAATQATASQAAGGGTVRHVATAFSACLYTSTAATIPVAQAVVVRDGATGAGTVFHTQAAGSGTAQGAQCVNSPSGFSRIGTANTAMTIEFTAAPPANVLQTVNMTGYSVP